MTNFFSRQTTKRFATFSLFALLIGTCINCHGQAVKAVAAPEAKLAQEMPTMINGSVIIEPVFSGPERDIIVSVIEEWELASNGGIHLTISDNPNREYHEMITIRQIRANEAAKKTALASGKPAALDEEGDAEPDDGEDGVTSHEDFWNTSHGCTNQLVILRTTSRNPKIMKMEIDSGMTAGENSTGFMGYTNPNCGLKYIMLVVDRLNSTKSFHDVIIHELGHAFGLRHTFNKWGGVMYAENEQAPCVTKQDMDNFCARWKCNSKLATPGVCPGSKTDK
jgi:hypothetical protein